MTGSIRSLGGSSLAVSVGQSSTGGSVHPSSWSNETSSTTAGNTLAFILGPSRCQPTSRETRLRQEAYLLRAPSDDRQAQIREDLNTVREVPRRPTAAQAARTAIGSAAADIRHAQLVLGMASFTGTSIRSAPPELTQRMRNTTERSALAASQAAAKALQAAERAASLAGEMEIQRPELALKGAQTAKAVAIVAAAANKTALMAEITARSQGRSARGNTSERAREFSRQATQGAKDAQSCGKTISTMARDIVEPQRQAVLPLIQASRHAARMASLAADTAVQASRAATEMASMPWPEPGVPIPLIDY